MLAGFFYGLFSACLAVFSPPVFASKVFLGGLFISAFQCPFTARATHKIQPLSRAKVIVRCAIGLIAAKPEKPCDKGVFEALNLLLKAEQNAS